MHLRKSALNVNGNYNEGKGKITAFTRQKHIIHI